jgi:uncharacterized protein YjgD (DUF1641 family)
MSTTNSDSLPAAENSEQKDRIAALENKLDNLSASVAAIGEQIEFLTQQAYESNRRQREWDELRGDLAPIANDLYKITVDQLEEIQAYVQLEDILGLAKRLARNTRNIDQLLDQMESMQDLWRDIAPLTDDMFHQLVVMLNDMEQKGYFGFVRQSAYVADQIVTSFSEEDVQLLGDNVVLILETVKALTQPEMMNLVNNLTQGFQDVDGQADELPSSLFGLMGQMRDPDVRRGLAITMAMLKRVSQQHVRTNGTEVRHQ